MIRLLMVLTMAALGLTGADVTGKWSGTLSVAGESEKKPAFLVLKQEGTKITGTAGPRESEQFPVEDGTVENGHVTFRVPEHSMKFDLVQDGEELKGGITRDQGGEKQAAAIVVKREK
ncbi:MAG: hypothetical protein ABI693_19660 [Bryobacteraceae bacterium]